MTPDIKNQQLGGHGFSGVPSWLKTIIDFKALQCISGYLHPNALNAF
jgi:hypothetical protein